MMDQDVVKAVGEFRDQKAREFGILRIGLFGSVTRGSLTDASDIDIVVEMSEPDLFAMIGIKQELEQLLHRRVDIVRYRSNMNPFLKQRIDQEAIYV